MEINRPEHKSIKDMSLEELQAELERTKKELKMFPKSEFWPKRVLEIKIEIEDKKALR